MKEKRNKGVYFLASQSEVDRIHLKMDEMGIRSLSAYLRKMALDGYCVKLDLADIKEMIFLLRNCSNNLNQYAKKANQTDYIYQDDIADLQVRFDEIWEMTKKILERLSGI